VHRPQTIHHPATSPQDPAAALPFPGRRLPARWLSRRWVHHLLFWGLSFYVLLRFFAYEATLTAVDWIYTFLFHLSLIFVVYVNLRWLIPRLFSRERYLLYALGWGGVVAAGAGVNLLTFQHLADRLFPGYYFISYYNVGDILQFTAVYGALSTLLNLSKSWFRLQEERRRLVRLEREKSDAELRALRTQLDPHFLFNNLNSLYSLALDEDRRLPDLILKLSENLRYMLYECREDYVPLARELDYVNDYLALQRLRLGDRVGVRLDQSGCADELKVAPLLFLPFIENAFKHGIRGGGRTSYVHLGFDITPARLRFRLVNSIAAAAAESLPTADGGIGIGNTRRRLELLYPGRHRLDIAHDRQQFSVMLQIEFQ
jgi:two-component system, LytTR family, sensor kinase